MQGIMISAQTSLDDLGRCAGISRSFPGVGCPPLFPQCKHHIASPSAGGGDVRPGMQVCRADVATSDCTLAMTHAHLHCTLVRWLTPGYKVRKIIPGSVKENTPSYVKFSFNILDIRYCATVCG